MTPPVIVCREILTGESLLTVTPVILKQCKGTDVPMTIVRVWRGSTACLYCSLVYFTSQPFVLKGLIPHVSPCKCKIYGFPWRFLLFSYLH